MSNIYRDIQKRLKGWLENAYTSIPQNIYSITKNRLNTPTERGEKYFPGFIAFIDSIQNNTDTKTKGQEKKVFYLDKKRKETY